MNQIDTLISVDPKQSHAKTSNCINKYSSNIFTSNLVYINVVCLMKQRLIKFHDNHSSPKSAKKLKIYPSNFFCKNTALQQYFLSYKPIKKEPF